MTQSIKRAVKQLARKLGADIVRYQPGIDHGLPPDLSNEDKRIITAVRPFTMTSIERIAAMIEATRHVARHAVPGAIVECGVWRGGSTMAAVLTLCSLGQTDRKVYLYDTFEGMSEPTEKDWSHDGVSAPAQLAQAERGTGIWCRAPLEDVRSNVLSTGYPASKIHFVPGKVEVTIPETLPSGIALLRLDTDWYESTRHELEHLFPLLHPQGVLIVE